MIKNKLNKILIIYTCIVMLISSVSIFADEEEEIIENETQDEIIEEQEEITPSQYDLEQDTNINNIQNNLNEILLEQEEIRPLLMTAINPTTSGAYGIARNYNNINNTNFDKTLRDYYFNVYNNYDFVLFQNTDSSRLKTYMLIKKEDVTSNTYETDHYIIECTRYLSIENNRGTKQIKTYDTSKTFNFYDNRYYDTVANNYYNWYKFTDNENNIIYNLQPYKINIENYNELITINNNTYTEDYIYYSNETITLTYDNTNNDFYCWYDTKLEKIISKDSTYTFNITQNYNLKIITNEDYENALLNNNDKIKPDIELIKYMMFILIGYSFIKGAISYDR